MLNCHKNGLRRLCYGLCHTGCGAGGAAGIFCLRATLALEARRAALRRLYGELRRREGDVAAALRADLGKCPEEAYMCETGLLLGGIRYLERHLPALMRARRAPTPLTQFRARSFVSPSPLGAVLIISPWNYPFLLSLGAAGGGRGGGEHGRIEAGLLRPRLGGR